MLLNPAAPASAAGCRTEFLSRHSAKVLIQEVATRRFLTAAGVWTSQLELAMSFGSGSNATEHMIRNKLTNVRLVLTRAITDCETISTNSSL